MSWARGWPWWLLLLAGLAGGTFSERAELAEHATRAPVHRAGWRVLDVDLHVHTRLSDGVLSPFEVVLAARRHGLDAIAVTEHNTVLPAKLARWFSTRVGGPTVLIGEEVTSSEAHIIAIGLDHTVVPRHDLAQALDAIHAQGGLAIAAHPVRRYWPALLPVLDRLDGAELMHPMRVREHLDGPGPDGWRAADLLAFHTRAAEAGFPLFSVGSSDFHFFNMLGLCRTWVFAADASEASVLDALRAHRTVVEAPDGSIAGHPDLVASIASDPPPGRTDTHHYRARDALDGISRLCGFVGLLGLLLLPAASRRAAPTRPPK